MGVVADRDDQLTAAQHVLDAGRSGVRQVESVPPGDLDRPGMDASSGMGAG